VTYWDPATGKQLQVLTLDLKPLSCIAFSPDGHFGAAGGENGQVVVWEVGAS
jgi:WD40 repeat protein